MIGLDDFYKFLIQTLTFIPKNKIENILATSLTSTDYYIICCGVGLVLIVFIGFVLGMTFKIWSYGK